MSDIPKDRGLRQTKSFQRHYFPEIFSEPGPEADPDRGVGKGFQRAELVGSGRARIPSQVVPLSESSRPTSTAALPADGDIAAGTEIYSQGYDEGEKVGIAAERGRLESIIKMLRLAMAEVEQVKTDLNRAVERQAVHLAMAVARKILHTEIETNPEAVAHVIRGALEYSAEAEQLTVKVNPGDLHILTSLESRSPDLAGALEKCDFESDEQIPAGGCVIQSELGTIDARIANQLEIIEERFLTILDESNLE